MTLFALTDMLKLVLYFMNIAQFFLLFIWADARYCTFSSRLIQMCASMSFAVNMIDIANLQWDQPSWNSLALPSEELVCKTNFIKMVVIWFCK